MADYVLDTNFFNQAHRSTYPLDIATGFWTAVKSLAEDDVVCSIDKVHDEIFTNDDDLTEWIDSNIPDAFFKDTDTDPIVQSYQDLAPWAIGRSDHYKEAAISEFLEYDNADAWLVAYCKSTGLILVTQETSDPTCKNRVKIPDVCLDHGVSFINMIEMFREIGVKF